MDDKSVNKQALFNILSTIVISGISFFTVPIFTRLLGPVEYGKYAVFYSWLTIITCVMGLHTQTSISTGVYDYKKHYYNFRSSVLLIGTIISGLLIGFFLIFSTEISALLEYTSPILILLIIGSYAHYVVDFVRISMIYEKKALINFILSTTLALSTVMLSILLLIYYPNDEKFISRAHGLVAPYCVVAAMIFVVIILRHPTIPSKEHWKYSVLMGAPIIFHELANKILGQSDLIMLERLGNNLEEVGIYSLFNTYTNVLNVILTALNTTWVPFFFDYLSQNRITALKEKIKHYLELFTLICVVYILMSREVSYLFADVNFRTGMNLIPIFTISIFFIFMYQFSINLELFKKKTGIIAIGTCLAAGINIVINAILIPIYGMFGAVIGTAISYFVLFVAHYIVMLNLQDGKSYVTLFDFAKWLFIIVLSCLSFYQLDDYVFLRWGVATIIGVFCVLRIVRRRAIF